MSDRFTGSTALVTARDQGRGLEVVDVIRSGGGRADFVAADFGHGSVAVTELAQRTWDVVDGRLDILVNNAASVAVWSGWRAQPWGSIGYSLPALLGAQLANSARRGLLLIGDGAAQMTIQELGTLARNNRSLQRPRRDDHDKAVRRAADSG